MTRWQHVPLYTRRKGMTKLSCLSCGVSTGFVGNDGADSLRQWWDTHVGLKKATKTKG